MTLKIGSAGPSYKIQLTSNGQDYLLRIEGVLDERVKLKEIQTELIGQFGKAKRLVIDLGAITRLNSVGLREWLLFLNQVQNQIPCEVSRLSEAVALQAVNLPAILGKPGTPLGEFEVPYRCPKCKTRIGAMLREEQVQSDGKFTPPDRSCETCGSPMEFDAVAEDYLIFLGRQR